MRSTLELPSLPNRALPESREQAAGDLVQEIQLMEAALALMG
jgi:hypothetical protein